MVTPGGWSVVVDPQHTRLAMRPPNAPPGLPHHPVPGLRGTSGLYTNRHAVNYFTALLCGIPLSSLPAPAWVSQPGECCVVAGTAFGPGRQRRCTLVAVWSLQMAAPWILLTDQPPDAVSLEVYGLRVWIEQGFRILKREGWHGHRTRRLDPARVDRHWRVMAVATLQVLAHGTRVEDAALLGRHPWHLTQAPATLPAPPTPRAVSVFRLGLTPLRRLCFQGRTWQGLWLRPESTAAPPLLSVTA